MSILDMISGEPKMSNKFLVEFPKEFNIQCWSIQKTNLPKFINGEWGYIKIEFFDVFTPSTSNGLFKIVNFVKTKKDETDELFNIKIKLLDSIGVEVEEWVISVKKVLIVNFGELDYNKSDEILSPYLIVKPEKCVLNTINFSETDLKKDTQIKV